MTPAQKRMLEELYDLDEELTPWEIDFVESLDEDATLTAAQAEKLEQIHEERGG